MLDRMQADQRGRRDAARQLDGPVRLAACATATPTTRTTCPSSSPAAAAARSRTGRHLVYGKNTPLCNLYAAMLDRMGAPVDRFGDSTGELAGLSDPIFKGLMPPA